MGEPTTPDNYFSAATLVGLRSPETPKEILRFLDSDDAQARAAMAEAVRDGIGETNTNQPGGWLQIGRQAEGSIQIGDQTQAVVHKLIEVSRDRYPGVQKAAVEALENIKEKIAELESGRVESVRPEAKVVAHPEKMSQAIDEALQTAEPAAIKRYADATFYDSRKKEQHRVPDNTALIEDRWY